jgi:DNA-binding transcriptional LysR family regulator
MLVVFPKGHPFSQFTEIPLDWLDNEPFMVSEYTYANDVHRLLKKHNIKPDIKYTLSNDFSILSLVEHNLGITILPAMILRNRTGNFETRPLKPNLYRQMGMAITSEDNLSPAAKIFIRYAKDYLFD